GKMDVNLKDLGVDFASFSGHKFNSLKGCGVLYIKRGLTSESLIFGGGQERGRRAGTENLLAIASLGHRCREKTKPLEYEHLRVLRDHFERRVSTEITEVKI